MVGQLARVESAGMSSHDSGTLPMNFVFSFSCYDSNSLKKYLPGCYSSVSREMPTRPFSIDNEKPQRFKKSTALP